MFKRILSAVVLMACVGSANAAIISQDIVVPRNNALSDPIVPKIRFLSFNLFDNLGGTRVLDSVDIQMIASGTGKLTFVNNSASSDTFNVTFSTLVSLLFIEQGYSLVAQPSEVISEFTLGSFATHVIERGAGEVTDTVSTSITDAGLLALFTGNGQNDFRFSHTGNSTIGTDADNYTVTRTTFSQGNVNIVYNYSYVPATGSFSLLLLGIGMMTLRRFSKA